MAALFAIDAFAGGLAVQAVLAWWFAHRFGASTVQLGLVFFAANLVPALAQLAAPLLAARRGPLAAMLVTHFASNLVLACIPLAPSLGGAVALLLLRQALSKIDVPARQAFTAAVVPARDRTAAASMTSPARSLAVSVSPLAATALLTGPLAEAGAPLLLGPALAHTGESASCPAQAPAPRDQPAPKTAPTPNRRLDHRHPGHDLGSLAMATPRFT